MRKPSALLALLGLALSPNVQAAPVAPTPVPQEGAPAAQEEPFSIDLGDEVDASIRWLRGRQAPDGSYGGGVEGTAWALHALAVSPRAYARRDGPFVRGALDYLAARQDPESGAIHDADADRQERLAQSVLALLALAEYDDPETNAVRERLAAGIAVIPSDAKPAQLSREEAEALALRWLGRRGADRSWEGEEGAVIATSRAVIELSRAWKVLKPKSEPARDASRLPAFEPARRAAVIDSMRRGALFLVATSEEGRWGAPGQPDAGLTAMALGALESLPAPRPEAVQQVIDQGLAWLVSLQQPDGSIHDGKLKNYITSAAVLALAASGDARYRPVIEKARAFLSQLQADEGEGYTDGDLYYGGIGYGGDERPDLSNLQMALEALAESGSEQGDEVFRRALKFLERTQNRSESNDTRIAADGSVIVSGDDGGAGYAPGDSKAGFDELPDGTKVPRSYGSMTYALLKGLIFAGLPKEDPRMQAAWEWIRAHYTLDVNPGFEKVRDPRAPYQGLYYYFHTMARALDLYGEELVVDSSGVEHRWREQLSGRLLSMQRKDDGSWTNENAPRWWEGNPVLATSYALLSLGAALPGE